MKRTDKEESIRIEKCFLSIISKFSLDLNLVFLPLSKADQKQSPETYFTIERSLRGKSDLNSFIVHFNPERTKNFTQAKIKRHAFHEIIHALTWPFIDNYEVAITHVKNQALQQELIQQHIDARETVTYLIERKLGPFCLPEADWSSTSD